MDITSKFTTSEMGFLLTVVFGLWLSKSGKPYTGILFNVHKLIALATMIVVVTQIYNILRNTEIQPIIITLIVIVGLCIIALFTSGALMSMEKLNYNTMLTIHRIMPIVAVIAMGLTIYLLNTLVLED